MTSRRKWLSVLMGLVLSVGFFAAANTDALAKVSEYQIGSLITSTADTFLFQEANCNTAKLIEVPEKGVAIIVENADIYTKVSYQGVEGYLYQEFIGYDEQAIAEYNAMLEAQRLELLKQSEEIKRLAAIIQLEAGYEIYEGQVAVGAVVMNRVKSTRFPNTISEVIYQPGQFTPAGRVEKIISENRIKESCHAAAMEAFMGADNTEGRLFFRRNDGREGLVIGNHVFH